MRRKPPPEPAGPMHERILTDLRQRIRDGIWLPGGRMPTVRELCAIHHTSLLTVHRALRALTDLGFVTTHGRRGTVVAEHPPHRCRFGLVLPELPDATGHYAHLRWEALARAAHAFTEPQRVVEIFHEVGPHPELVEHQRLRRAIADRRLAGLIMPVAGPVPDWLHLDAYSLPIIGGEVASPAQPHRGSVHLVQHDFIDAALDQVVRRKLSRVSALLHCGAAGYGGESHLMQAATTRGLTLPAHGVLGVDPQFPVWTTNAVQALMHARPAPEVLIIADDHLVATALIALHGMRTRPQLIVTQANLPIAESLLESPPSEIVCVQIGWDHRDYLSTALDHLSRHLTTGDPVGDHQLPLRITGAPL